jgi:hypothetical protein
MATAETAALLEAGGIRSAPPSDASTSTYVILISPFSPGSFVSSSTDDLFLGPEANEATLEGVGLRVVGLGVVASAA